MRHAVWFALLASTCLIAAELKPGERVGNLTFKDIRFLTRTLDDLPGKATVIVFMNTSCPVAARYVPTLRALEATNRERGVRFLALFSGADDSIAALATFAVKHNIEFPCCKDYDAECATKLGVTKTPEVVVLDAERKLRYRGRIDDRLRPGGALPKPANNDLRDAIDAVLNGKDIASPITPVDGCAITFDTPKAPEQFTFAEHVAQSCGSIAKIAIGPTPSHRFRSSSIRKSRPEPRQSPR